jgi:hypothetical protein
MNALQRHYVAGSHSDYYLLLDEQSDRIFTARLAEHIREAQGVDPVGGLPEIWMDHKGRRVWYVFHASQNAEPARHPDTGQGGHS